MDPQEVICSAIRIHCSEMFEHYEVPLTETDGLDDDQEMIAVIGFSSENLKGALGLACAKEPLARSACSALGLAEVDDQILTDWLGELSNQLLGRLKRTMLDYSVEIYLATPIVLSGLKLSIAGNSPAARVSFTTDSGGIWASVETRFPEGLKLVYSPPSEDDTMMDDGMAMFF